MTSKMHNVKYGYRHHMCFITSEGLPSCFFRRSTPRPVAPPTSSERHQQRYGQPSPTPVSPSHYGTAPGADQTDPQHPGAERSRRPHGDVVEEQPVAGATWWVRPVSVRRRVFCGVARLGRRQSERDARQTG